MSETRALVALDHLWNDQMVCVVCGANDPEEKCLASWGRVLALDEGTERDDG